MLEAATTISDLRLPNRGTQQSRSSALYIHHIKVKDNNLWGHLTMLEAYLVVAIAGCISVADSSKIHAY
ncbi:hypothetical protein BDV29DRAFT_6838 [Aspergillus leporis]|jgi:hypothetical protein|uniref:Uncharacterized protein n=1 Tax=Aspergillus leporis TaxID=41062 RepID=A0A5N5WYK5_9EURO|nr:hypothetical protein BDV29DRAFT_6838 [Aspergillus leporis]